MDLNEDEDEDVAPESVEKEDDSDEESEEEGEDDEFIDVLDVLDGRGEPYMSDDETKKPASEKGPSRKAQVEEDEDIEDEAVEARGDEDDEDEDDEDEESADEKDEDEDIISASEDESADPDALDKLGAFVSSLETSSKRKAGDEDDSPSLSKGELSKMKKRKLLPERTESGLESEFGAKLAGKYNHLFTKA